MPDWATFVGLTGVVITLFLALARLSQTAVRDDSSPAAVAGDNDESSSGEGPGALSAAEVETRYGDATTSSVAPDPASGGHTAADGPATDRDGGRPAGPDGDDSVESLVGDPTEEQWAVEVETETSGEDRDPTHAFGRDRDAGAGPTADGRPGPLDGVSTGALLANVALTQGVFGALVVAAAFYTSVPASAFGITGDPLSTGLPGVAVGVALGVALYVANELGAASADALGVEYDEQLRAMLSPDSAGGWLLLFGGVLPVIAAVEEFLFRAAIVGAVHAGFGTSPWALAVVSSLAFAIGHGAQGRVGIVVTGALGFVLAAAFVLTGSLLVVFVAHYVVNALEFAVHELLGIEWADSGTD